MDRKKLDIAISIIAAIVLWFYVINIENPITNTVIRDVPINMEGTVELQERGYAVSSASAETLDINIQGTRNEVLRVSAADISVRTNVSGLSEGSSSVVISYSVPQGITVTSVETNNVTYNVEKYVTVSKPVDIIMEGASGSREQRGSAGAVAACSDRYILSHQRQEIQSWRPGKVLEKRKGELDRSDRKKGKHPKLRDNIDSLTQENRAASPQQRLHLAQFQSRHKAQSDRRETPKQLQDACHLISAQKPEASGAKRYDPVRGHPVQIRSHLCVYGQGLRRASADLRKRHTAGHREWNMCHLGPSFRRPC